MTFLLPTDALLSTNNKLLAKKAENFKDFSDSRVLCLSFGVLFCSTVEMVGLEKVFRATRGWQVSCASNDDKTNFKASPPPFRNSSLSTGR